MSADWILPESQPGTRPRKVTAKRTAAGQPSATEDRDDVLAGQGLAALGGKANVQSVEGCITRLRLFVNDPAQIDDVRLKSLGASGVVKRVKISQRTLWTQSDRNDSRINRLLND